MSCDLCGATESRTRFCEACGVDYCDDCAFGAHDAMHDVMAPIMEAAVQWVNE